MQVQINRFLDDGALAGDMRGLAIHEDGLTLFRHDGLVWAEVAAWPWPDQARIVLELDGDRTELPEAVVPTLIFEPYGAVPDFALILQDRQADYVLRADERGDIVRMVER